MNPEDIAADQTDAMLRRLMNEHMTLNEQRQVVPKTKAVIAGTSSGAHFHQGQTSISPWKMPSTSTSSYPQQWNYQTVTKQEARNSTIDVAAFLKANQGFFTKATLEQKSGSALSEISLTTNSILFKEFLKANGLTPVITDETEEALQDQATELELSNDVKKGMALAAAFFAKFGQVHLSELL